MIMLKLKKVVVTAIGSVILTLGAALPTQAATLTCKLYINDATAKNDTVTPPHAGVALNTMRAGGVCVFADGNVTEKQFVMISQAMGDGSSKTASVYDVTFNID